MQDEYAAVLSLCGDCVSDNLHCDAALHKSVQARKTGEIDD